MRWHVQSLLLAIPLTFQKIKSGVQVKLCIAIVSSKMEGSDADKEVIPGLALLGNIMQRFTTVVTTYEPVADGSSDKCFISSSFDASSHFEGDVDDLLALYKRVTGKDLDMSINADSVEADY